MMHRFGTRRTVAVLAMTGSLLAGGVVTATQSNAEPLRGPNGIWYEVNGHLGSKAVPGGAGSWRRAWNDCRADPNFGSKVRGIKKFRSFKGIYWKNGLQDWVGTLDDYFCSSSTRP